MTTTIDVMKQAAEALEKTMPVFNGTCAWHNDVKQAITALRAEIERLERCEPVAWIIHRMDDTDTLDFDLDGWKEIRGSTPLYAHPAPAIPEGWQKDAERYRYLRHASRRECLDRNGPEAGCWIDCEDENHTLILLTEEDADNAIDAAMAKVEG